MAEDSEKQPPVTADSPTVIPHTIFTRSQKSLIVTLVAVAATFSAFASNIYFPAIPAIAVDLSTTEELINLTVTSYMIFQGLAPSIWGAMADVKGRRVTYIVTFIVFIGACIGIAESKYYYQLLILRCLQSTGSASTIAIGAGVVGDITTREDRGSYMGIFQAGLLAPLAIGPVLGGVFAQTLGWRAIFWFLTIYAAAFLVVLVFVLPETLRSMVGNGSVPAKGLSQSLLGYIQQRRHPTTEKTIPDTPSNGRKARIDVLGPLKIILSAEVSFVIIFLSIHYMVWQMSVAATSTLFQQTYGLNEIQIGLTYIANGAGMVLCPHMDLFNY